MAINLDETFRPTVSVFDGNAVIGRRHDRRVRFESAGELLSLMDRRGIGRALVYTHYAATFDSSEGNALLLDLIGGADRLVPQFVVNLASEFSAGSFAASVRAAGVRSLRVHPKDHLYPFAPWIVERWAAWLDAERLPVWVPMDQADARDIHATATAFPSLTFVLSGVHYSHHAVVHPLLRACPNLCMELSRYDVPNGAEMIHRVAGPDRLVFGSCYPDLDPGPYLYYLHHCGFSESELGAICAGNLERLLAPVKGVVT